MRFSPWWGQLRIDWVLGWCRRPGHTCLEHLLSHDTLCPFALSTACNSGTGDPGHDSGRDEGSAAGTEAWGLLGPQAVVVTDLSGQVLDLSAGFSTLSGHARAGVLEQPVDRVLTLASRLLWHAHALPALLRRGELLSVHMQLLGAAQQVIPVVLNLRAGQFEGQIAHRWAFRRAKEHDRF